MTNIFLLLMKCYQLIGKVFWKSIIMQIYFKSSWDIVIRFDNVSKTLLNKCYYTIFIRPLKFVIKMLCVCWIDSENIAKNREKGRENQEKEGKNQEKEEKSGRFFYFGPLDR